MCNVSPLHSLSHIQQYHSCVWSLQVARGTAIFLFYPLLSTGRIGYPLTWKAALFMVWAGLRGAVSSTTAGSMNNQHQDDEECRCLPRRLEFRAGAACAYVIKSHKHDLCNNEYCTPRLAPVTVRTGLCFQLDNMML